MSRLPKLFSKYSYKLVLLLFVFIFLQLPVQASTDNWQKGFTLQLIDQSDSQISKSLEDLAAVGANYVTISPGWVTDNKYSSNVERKSRTPSDYKVRYAIRKAKLLGMDVMIKPHLDRKDGGWRAFIDPSNKDKFFQNYSAMMLNYADIAQQEGADQLCVGAELFKLSTKSSNEHYWRDMISKIRQRFDGSLTYSANSDSEYFDEGGLPFWDALDYWGSSMYISVSKTTNPTSSIIQQEWKWAEDRYYKPMSQKIGLPLLATEIGYRSVDGAGISPEEFENNPKLDLAEQALLYQNFFDFWDDRSYFAGVQFWFWEAGDNVGGPTNKDYTVQGKPAQEVVKQNFTSSSSSGSGSGTTGSTSGSNSGSSSGDTSSSSNAASYEFFKNILVNGSGSAPVATTKTGAQSYTDRDYTFTSFKNFLTDGEFIQLKNGDKNSTSSSYLKFELKKTADLYIAYDSRASKIPDWLKTWENTEYNFVTSDATFTLFRKPSQSGSITLGGNMSGGASGAQSNYIVLVSTGIYVPKDNSSNSSGETTGDTTGDTNTNTQDNTDTSNTNSDNTSNSNDSTSSSDSSNTATGSSSSISGKIEVKDPDDGQKISGEKKVKFELKGVSPEEFVGTYDVEGDGKGAFDMENSGDNKQDKVNFDAWTWNGEGPYKITFYAKDKSGNLIDSKSIQIYVKH